MKDRAGRTHWQHQIAEYSKWKDWRAALADFPSRVAYFVTPKGKQISKTFGEVAFDLEQRDTVTEPGRKRKHKQEPTQHGNVR